jgi:hypothetical protein
VEAMRLLARIGMTRSVFDDAELLLATVCRNCCWFRSPKRRPKEVAESARTPPFLLEHY